MATGLLFLGVCLGINWLVVSNYVLHQFFIYLYIYIIVIIIINYLLFLIKLCLCQPTNSLTFTFFDSFPYPTVRRDGVNSGVIAVKLSCLIG